jgi:RNA polymerase sigma-70 factor (ECF subfamily)
MANAELGTPEDPIVAHIVSGAHREAVALCAREHGAALGRLCMAMLGSQGEAEEVAQEVLIVAHGAMGSFRFEGSPRAWLFGIARRVCAKRIAKRTRRNQLLHLVHDAEASPEGPHDLAARRERALKVRSALERLKPTEREALLLRYQAGLGFREVAAACGIEEAAARKRASRGLQAMRKILDPEVMR